MEPVTFLDVIIYWVVTLVDFLFFVGTLYLVAKASSYIDMLDELPDGKIQPHHLARAISKCFWAVCCLIVSVGLVLQ